MSGLTIRNSVSGGARQTCRVCLAALGVAFLVVGCAQPQEEPAQQQPEVVTAEKPAQQTRITEPVAKDEPKQQALQRRQGATLKQQTPRPVRRNPQPTVASTSKKPANKTKSGCGSKGAANLTPLKPDPNLTGTPQYVCAKPIVRAEPVWTGKPVTFDFEFANRGTADLLIKLKGG